MKRLRLAVALVLVLPAAGCVFAVGSDNEKNEELRDRVRALEHRIHMLEGGPGEFEGRPRRSEYMPAGPRPPAPPAPPAPPPPPVAPK